MAKSTLNHTAYSKFTFRGASGYIVAPWISGLTHELMAIRHSACVPPWTDRDVHLHSDSEEYYLVLEGELQLVVADSATTLSPARGSHGEATSSPRGGRRQRTYRALRASGACGGR